MGRRSVVEEVIVGSIIADGTGGHSGKLTEVPRKMAVVRKSHGQCDLGQRQFAIVKRVLGGFNTSPQ